MSEDLNDIIRASFEGEGFDKAPESIWSAVDQELSENKVDNIVKSSFEGQQDMAPEMVWERVQDQLDIDRVWTRIAGKISIRNYNVFLKYAATVLVFLMPFALDYDLEQLVSSQAVKVKNQISVNAITAPMNLGVSPNTNDNITFVPLNNGSDANNSVFVNSTPTLEPKKLTENNVNKESLALNMGNLEPLAVSTVNASNTSQLQPVFKHKPKRNLGLLIGGISSLENTWILDNETRAGFDAESLIESKFSLGANYGASVEYQFKRNWSINGEYLFQSRSSQNTNYFDNGVYSRKKREINMYKLSLTLGFNTQPKFYGVTHSTMVKVGGYFSGVKSDYTYLNGYITNVNSVYKRNDVGLRLEVGKRVYLGSFAIDGGIRANYGLMNLASEKSAIPTSLNYTRLVSGGVFLRASYAL